MRGQLSLEFMVVFTGMLLIVASVTYPLYNQAKEEAEKLTKLSEAKEALNTIVNAVNMVYAGGPGSRQTVDYWLPRGVLHLYLTVDRDGIAVPNKSVAKNGRLDAQIFFDFDGNGEWDNTWDSVVLADTLLPSRWFENGSQRNDNWVNENAVHPQDWNFLINSSSRTHHRTTFEYFCGPISYSGELLALWNLSQIHENELETTLFGIPLEVEAENHGSTIHAELEFGSGEQEGTGTNFTLSITDSGITVKVIVTAPTVEIRYWASFLTPPFKKQILISDVIMESV
ncbi:MAG: class III signal peptide-containing protein [Candidatus Hadarchaeales archaeon]